MFFAKGGSKSEREREKKGVMKSAVKWTSTVDQIEKSRMVDVDVDREKCNKIQKVETNCTHVCLPFSMV